MKDMEKIPFGNLDTNEPDELELLDKLLDEKYQQTVDTKTKNDKAS